MVAKVVSIFRMPLFMRSGLGAGSAYIETTPASQTEMAALFRSRPSASTFLSCAGFAGVRRRLEEGEQAGSRKGAGWASESSAHTVTAIAPVVSARRAPGTFAFQRFTFAAVKGRDKQSSVCHKVYSQFIWR
jgi:hypothetical protein